ncbi:MAG: pyridoxal-phosphate dependent enzyme [Candidatus Aenigmatarchaeota archaeon]
MLNEILELRRHFDLNNFYSWLSELGIGFTNMLRIPETINPFDKDIPIFAKLEYTNFGESVKARPFSTIYYLNFNEGRLDGKRKVVAATSGNFGLAGSYLLMDKFNFTVYMSENTVKENKQLIKKLINNKVEIEAFSDGYCPAVGAKRGQAIAAARYIEKKETEIINFDQYDNFANPLSHFLTTAPEIYHQTNGEITHFVISLGTCGTMLGCGTWLRQNKSDIKLIGLIPEEGHHQLGLRSRDELGASTFFKETEKLCDDIIEVSDRDAYNAMLMLWNTNIPAGISSGTNFYGSLKVAEKLNEEKKKGVIVTILPDSCENYEEFLRRHLKKITNVEFKNIYKKFEDLKELARIERERHILELRKREIKLVENMIKDAKY